MWRLGFDIKWVLFSQDTGGSISFMAFLIQPDLYLSTTIHASIFYKKRIALPLFCILCFVLFCRVCPPSLEWFAGSHEEDDGGQTYQGVGSHQLHPHPAGSDFAHVSSQPQHHCQPVGGWVRMDLLGHYQHDHIDHLKFSLWSMNTKGGFPWFPPK